MQNRSWIVLSVVFVVLLAGTPAGAVLVASGDGGGNTSAPVDDPGFANVGTVGGLSAVYLGEGWAITAAHVGVGELTLGGRRFAALPNTAMRPVNRDGSAADLIAFRLAELPDLPSLRVAQQTPALGSKLLMVGHGRDRGEALEWYGRPGWNWGPGKAMRWGTNHVSGVDADTEAPDGRTRSFYSDFSVLGEGDEAQATTGDSGGAVFVESPGGWRLAGLMIAIHAPFQPAETALDGNLTYAADLAFYRDQFVEAGVLPEVEAPVLQVSATRVFAGVLRVGGERVVRVAVANRGNAPLTIHSVSLAEGGSTDYQVKTEGPLPLRLASLADDPAASFRYLYVRLAPTARGWHLGRLVIESDDPARPRVEIGLFGYAYGGFWGRF